jgi:hypothetical protein
MPSDVASIPRIQQEVSSQFGAASNVRINVGNGVKHVTITLDRLPPEPAAAKRTIEAIIMRHVPDANAVEIFVRL